MIIIRGRGGGRGGGGSRGGGGGGRGGASKPSGGGGGSRKENDDSLGGLSRKMTYLLRHGAVKEGVPITPDGFISFPEMFKRTK